MIEDVPGDRLAIAMKLDNHTACDIPVRVALVGAAATTTVTIHRL
jgi:hypothetical protein